MKKLILIASVFLSLNVNSQDNPTELAQPIVAEGKRMYRSEMASWYGTDLFLEKYGDQKNIGGYFSYADNDITKCIFFSRAEYPTVIGTISFDNSFDIKTANLDLKEREFSQTEKDLYTIRKQALQEINSDTLFRSYNNTNLNLVPLIDGREKKVYVLTGPKSSGVVIFGNDYLLTFDANNKLLEKKRLHKNIIAATYGTKEENGDQVVGAMHTHLPETGEFITATDICTLMLYAKFAKWKQYNVVSAQYLNIWNCETEQLTVVSMAAVEKIQKDQGRLGKKNQ